MTDDKKTLKFQMMMSPNEAEVLDDWMFKNRVRSRAEAIRRLTQIGLTFDRRAPDLLGEVTRRTEGIERVSVSARREDISSRELLQRILEMNFKAVDFSLFVVASVSAMVIELSALRGGKDIDEALALAKDLADRLNSLKLDEPEGREFILKALDALSAKNRAAGDDEGPPA